MVGDLGDASVGEPRLSQVGVGSLQTPLTQVEGDGLLFSLEQLVQVTGRDVGRLGDLLRPPPVSARI
jgi:hypothetical protein